MSHKKKYIEFENSLWKGFERLVRKGAKFPTLVYVTYPKGVFQKGLIKDNEGRSCFMAKELIKNSNYKLKTEVGKKDIIIEFNKVEFLDSNNEKHILEPDATDLYWICELLDSAN